MNYVNYKGTKSLVYILLFFKFICGVTSKQCYRLTHLLQQNKTTVEGHGKILPEMRFMGILLKKRAIT